MGKTAEEREIAEMSCSRHALRCRTWVLSATCCLKRWRAKLSIFCRVSISPPKFAATFTVSATRLRLGPPDMPGTPGGRHAGEPRNIVSAGVVGYASPNVCAFQVEVKSAKQFISMHIRMSCRTVRLVNPT